MSVLTIFTVVGALCGVALVLTFVLSLYKGRRVQDETWGHLDEGGVHRGLSLLLRRGYDGATAIFTDRTSGSFVQFRKYIHAPGSYGIEMHFPKAPWSARYYTGVEDVLKKHGLEYERVPLDSEPTVEVLWVDFSRDVDRASSVTADIVRDVFGRPEIRLKLQAEDICPLDELVEREDHPRPHEILRRNRAGAVRGL